MIDGKSLAEEIQARALADAARLKASGHEPHLVAVQIGGDAASVVYATKQAERFEKLGIRYTHRRLEDGASSVELRAALQSLNDDPGVTGILLLQPLPAGISAQEAQEQIVPLKDVEGLHPENVGRLALGAHRVGPCTALAVLAALKSTGEPLVGKNAVIIGRSNVVGKPAALLLLGERATVTVCHTATRDLSAMARGAEILVVAAGRPKMVGADMVGRGAIVIDVGIHRVDGKTVGDVDTPAAAANASWITPVPGGVGPVTVAMLVRNTLACAMAQARS